MIDKYKSEHLYEWMIEIRRKLHRHPELAFEEIETAKVLMGQLTKLGIPYDNAGPGHAVIGKLSGKKCCCASRCFAC